MLMKHTIGAVLITIVLAVVGYVIYLLGSNRETDNVDVTKSGNPAAQVDPTNPGVVFQRSNIIMLTTLLAVLGMIIGLMATNSSPVVVSGIACAIVLLHLFLIVLLATYKLPTAVQWSNSVNMSRIISTTGNLAAAGSNGRGAAAGNLAAGLSEKESKSFAEMNTYFEIGALALVLSIALVMVAVKLPDPTRDQISSIFS